MAERTFLQALAAAVTPRGKAYQVPSAPGGWFPLIREPFAGAWQRNISVDPMVAERFYVNEGCKTLIARDIAKLGVRLIGRDRNGIWTETTNPAFSPVLRRPNDFQTRNQFWESWLLSKLSRGNTYVLKRRDARSVVVALYVLDPRRVTPLVATDGSVFYQLATDELAGLPAQVTVPATEIIHDRFNCLFHPLVGVPPIYSSALAAMQGINIQTQSNRLFANAAQPAGILTAPGTIEQPTADRIKSDWKKNYGGENYGSVAVMGDGLKFEKMSLTAVEGQMLEQLKWAGEAICTSYHVPPFMVGIGPEPSTGSAQERTLRYYTQCLQSHIEDAEACLDDGLGLGDRADLGVEFVIENLLRMDTASQAEATVKLVRGGVKTPNDGRRDFGLPPLEGGDTVYLQQQDIPMSVAASVTEHPSAAKARAAAAAPPATPPTEPPPAEDQKAVAARLAHELRKSLRISAAA